MYLLSIHDGHTSTAALFRNNELLAAASEERFTRKKCQEGMPVNAINYVLNEAKIAPEDVDEIVLPTLSKPLLGEDLKLTGTNKLRRYVFRFSPYIPSRIRDSDFALKMYRALTRKDMSSYNEQIKEMGFKVEPYTLDHHLSHASAYYFSPFDKALVFTLDGSGDGLSGTVYYAEGDNLQLLKKINSYHSIGEMYTRVTQYLGMKPLEHEYKVMGLAPYASKKYGEQAYKKFSKYFTHRNGSIINTSGGYGLSFLNILKRDMFGVRFDNIAYGLQKRLEEVVLSWINYWVAKKKVYNIVLSGGVFMNVKLNMKIKNEFPNMFVFPSCGDESLPLTSLAYVSSVKYGKRPKPLGPIYLGPEYSSDQIENTLESKKYAKLVRYTRTRSPEREAARRIADGKIVARFNGRMEWGARALGNRSILADASNLVNVQKINRAIKKRDFWMPFAPSMLDGWHKEYLVNASYAPYMILAFQSTKLARKDLIAAMHQFDFTVRPQVVKKTWNPSYYELLYNYSKITGRGGLLNTSFNLHGFPIVNSPSDALRTLLNSEIDYLIMGNYIISRR